MLKDLSYSLFLARLRLNQKPWFRRLSGGHWELREMPGEPGGSTWLPVVACFRDHRADHGPRVLRCEGDPAPEACCERFCGRPSA
jgi:hypothetical protein